MVIPVYSNPSPPESDDEGERGVQIPAKSSAATAHESAGGDKKMKQEDSDEPVEWIYGQKFLKNEPVGAMERDFYCDTCKSMMNSECTWIKHVMGKRHIKKYAALNHVPVDRKTLRGKKRNQHSMKLVGGPSSVRTKTLDTKSMIQNVIDKERSPIIGLGFIIEIRLMERGAEPVYHCTLCPADCQMMTIIHHAIGYRHRMAYLKLCDPERYSRFNYSTQKKSILSERVEQCAAKIEQSDGRGEMIIELQVCSDNENVIDETADVEKCVPQLPKSTLAACKKQALQLPPSKRLQLWTSWVSDFLERMDMQEDQIAKLDSFGDAARKKYQDSMWNNLVGEKKERALKQLINCNYTTLMEEVFCLTAGVKGAILKEAVLKVVKERERGVRRVKKEKKEKK